jgi:hypothetical protein
MDILPDRWQHYENFHSFITMIVDSHFVTDKPRFILESMKLEGWRFVERDENGNKLSPIQNETTKLACISKILTEQTVQAKILKLHSNQKVNDFKTMKNSHPSIPLPVLLPSSSTASKTKNEQNYFVESKVKRKNKIHKQGDDISPTFTPSNTQILPRVTNEYSTPKSNHQLKKSYPHYESSSTIMSPIGRKNPRVTPTFEQIKMLVLENAKEFREREMLKNIQSTQAGNSSLKLLKLRHSMAKTKREKKMLSPRVKSNRNRTTQRNNEIKVRVKKEMEHPSSVECNGELLFSCIDPKLPPTQINLGKSLSPEDKSNAICKEDSEDVPSLESELPKKLVMT